MSDDPVWIVSVTPPLPCGRCGHQLMRLAKLVTTNGFVLGHRLVCLMCEPQKRTQDSGRRNQSLPHVRKAS